MTVDQVRNLLRGEPGTDITIQLERDVYSTTSRSTSGNIRDSTVTVTLSSTDPQVTLRPPEVSKQGKMTPTTQLRNEKKSIVTVNMKRQQVKISDVSLATYLGN